MVALAYLFPPLSGLIAYMAGSTPRARFHGLQSVLLGVVWPVSLFVGSWISPTATRIAFAVMGVVWLLALVTTALGRDPSVPGLRSRLLLWAEDSPRDP